MFFTNLLSFTVKWCFEGSNKVRITLFIPKEEYLIPLYRYRCGVLNTRIEAMYSKVKYKKGVSTTGAAWISTNELLFETFDFQDRKKMDSFYKTKLNIPKETIELISDEMVNVKQIMCYGFTDARGKLTGVLSIDIYDDILRNNVDLEALKEFFEYWKLSLLSYFS